jgi:hypothetical protein
VRSNRRPAFLVTIDTEGDDLWSRPREIRTCNAAFLPRFQRMCEAYGLRPTWLVNYEMALDDEFVRFARDAVRRGRAEVGMHLHAWNSPPLIPLTRDDYRHQPFLTEYPADILDAKVRFLTVLLRERFESPIVSHRAGRWGMDARYARALAELGFRIDCSVCPHVSWRDTLGDPAGRGGPDYRDFPSLPYLLDLDDIRRAGNSELLELPMSVLRSPLHRIAPWTYTTPGIRRWAWRGLPDRIWLYPDGKNLAQLQFILADALAKQRPYVEMVLHSSELMPGGAPNAPDVDHVECLYRDLHALFAVAEESFNGMTLSEFRLSWLASPQRRSQPEIPHAMTTPGVPIHFGGGDLG